MKISIAVSCILALAALGVRSEESAEKPKAKYQIGFAAKSFQDPFTSWQAQTVKKFAEQSYPDFDIKLLDSGRGRREADESGRELLIAKGGLGDCATSRRSGVDSGDRQGVRHESAHTGDQLGA